MKVGQARMIAESWVKQMASQETGFRGAYFTGSTIHLSDEVVLPKTSDVDMVIVTDHENLGLKLGKFMYNNVLLEVTHIPWFQLSSAHDVLQSYHLAGSFQHDTIIADPTGVLHDLQKTVSEHFSEAGWVRARYEAAIQKVVNGLQGLDATGSKHDQVMGWLFPTGVTTHALLVAALENPTVRLRYLATRRVLQTYHHDEIYQELLTLLGCEHLTASRVSDHLDALEKIFDQTVPVSRTPFFFSSDVSWDARPIAIDGSRKLIQFGDHQAAVFWIVATFSRCYEILKVDGSLELQQTCLSAFDSILADIGIYTTDDLISHAQRTIEYVPKLRDTSEKIMLANPKVTGK